MKFPQVFFLLVSCMLFSSNVLAVDGVVLINQATVMSAGGFPYYIRQPGSYKLSGNLVVTGDANSCGINSSCDAIHIYPTDNVTLDLNGFTISGPNVPGVGNGVFAQGSGVTVVNGRITGFGTGVFLLGSGETIRGVTISGGITGAVISGSGTIADTDVSESVVTGLESFATGLSITSDGLILRCHVTKTPSAADLGSLGITLNDGLVSESDVSGYFVGIAPFGSANVTNNSIHNNARGLSVQTGRTGYGSNTFVKNVLDVVTIGSGGATSMKNNVCSDGSVC